MNPNYIVVGTNDKSAAEAFYDALFVDTGIQRIYNEGRMTLWQGDGFLFAIAEPWDGNAATIGNGSMVGFQLDNAAAVDRAHALALELGGSSEGEPGPRSGRHAAYVRDRDGNKLCFYA